MPNPISKLFDPYPIPAKDEAVLRLCLLCVVRFSERTHNGQHFLGDCRFDGSVTVVFCEKAGSNLIKLFVLDRGFRCH